LPESIVDFARPPVVEVALAVQFGAPSLDTLDIAALADHFREAFPRRAEQPPRPPMQEDFEDARQPQPITVEFFPAPPTPRFWFLSEDESQLIQVQQDLVAYNWRRMRETDAYPRYTSLRRALVDRLRTSERILKERGKGSFEPNWCEVTYVNHVIAPETSKRRPPLRDVISLVSRGQPKAAFLPEPEDVQLAARYRIVRDDEPVGRLTVSAAPGIRNTDGRPIWGLTLTARVRASASKLDKAFEALDLGHEWVVRGFVDVTTKRMHDDWGIRGDDR